MQLVEDHGGCCLLIIAQDGSHIRQQAQAQPLLSLLPEKQNKQNSTTPGRVRPVSGGGIRHSQQRFPTVGIPIDHFTPAYPVS